LYQEGSFPIYLFFIKSGEVHLLRSNQEKATKPIEQVEDINDLKNKAKKTKVPKNLH